MLVLIMEGCSRLVVMGLPAAPALLPGDPPPVAPWGERGVPVRGEFCGLVADGKLDCVEVLMELIGCIANDAVRG